MPRVPSKRFTYSSPLSLWIRSKLSFTVLSKKISLFFFSLISLSRHVEGNGLVSFTTALAARGLIDKEKVQDGDRVRQLKARQMNERYSAIRNEMGKRLEEQKRDARTERSRLIRKYDEKIEIITAALEPQTKELESSKEQIGDLKMALDQMVKEKTRALDDSRRVEKLYQDKLGERSAEVAKLEMSIISYVELLSKRDAQIEQYETSYRELLRLTLRLTRERIGTQGRKALQSTGERIRNQGRRVRNGLFRQGTKK